MATHSAFLLLATYLLPTYLPTYLLTGYLLTTYLLATHSAFLSLSRPSPTLGRLTALPVVRLPLTTYHSPRITYH